MKLMDFNIKNLRKDLFNNKEFSVSINNFINTLKDSLEKNNNKYSNYWEYQNFIEDNVSAKIGLSRYGNDVKYSTELKQDVDESILEISNEEGVLYRKQFMWNGSTNGGFYNVDKFENGQKTTIIISKDLIPTELENKDIIFQIDKQGNIKVREDLKEKIINISSDKSKNLKENETNRNNEYKQEGHIYEVFEDDGYIFINDQTEKRGFSIEDIDFAVDNYEGEGKYQVINGKYQKIN